MIPPSLERLSVLKNQANSSGASSFTVKEKKLYYLFASTAILVDNYNFIEGDSDLIDTCELNASEGRSLIKLAKKVLEKSSRIIIVGGDLAKYKADKLKSILSNNHKTSIVIKDSDFSASSLAKESEAFYIIYTDTNSFTDFALLILFSNNHLTDVFAQFFNSSLFSVRVPEICSECSTSKIVDDALRSSPRKGFSYSHDFTNTPSPIGCDKCFSGYIGVYELRELITSDNDKVLEFLSFIGQYQGAARYKKFVNDLQTENILTVFTAATAAIEQGCISLDDVYKTIL